MCRFCAVYVSFKMSLNMSLRGVNVSFLCRQCVVFCVVYVSFKMSLNMSLRGVNVSFLCRQCGFLCRLCVECVVFVSLNMPLYAVADKP